MSSTALPNHALNSATYSPTMEPTIETPRLRLIRLQDTDINSQHLKWFHELWTDDEFTAWSLHGKCHSIQESQQWMTEHQTKFDSISYAILEKSDSSGKAHGEPGKLVGSVGLRTQDGPTLPPFPPPSTPNSQQDGTDENTNSKPLNLRSLGYAFFKSAWGKGYATEASKALLEAYTAAIAEEKAKGKELFYIEGTWIYVKDKDNPASQKVLKKLGFEEVGWKVVTERVFLAGAWRDPGYWIYGMYP